VNYTSDLLPELLPIGRTGNLCPNLSGEVKTQECSMSAGNEASREAKTYVLVHGAFLGGWCWKYVAGGLGALGHMVYTPTLTGLGERSHLLTAGPTLDTFIEDVAQVLGFEDLEDVILVGHSFSGSVVSALADRMPGKLRHLVYLDAQLLLSGQSPASGAPPESIERYRRRAIATSHGDVVPPFDPENLGVTDPKMVTWVRSKLTAHPLQTYFDKLELKNEAGGTAASGTEDGGDWQAGRWCSSRLQQLAADHHRQSRTA
jgi:pimeloyl-ACP methyl ester carboxylesterase